MMQFQDATFEEVQRAWAIFRNGNPEGTIPPPHDYYDTTKGLLDEIRDAEKGGLAALKRLVHLEGEGRTLQDYRRKLIQNVPHVRKILNERVGQTYSDPPDVRARIAGKQPDDTLVVSFNEYLRLIFQNNGGNNLFVRGLIRFAFRDRFSTGKVFTNPVTKKAMICHLEAEKVAYIPHPDVDKVFLAALEIRKAGANAYRYRLWTTKQRFEIDKDWKILEEKPNEVPGVVPYVLFGDADYCSDMQDAVMDQSAFINLRNTQHVGIRYQAFATKVFAGKPITPMTKTEDGREAVAGGVDHYVVIEKDGEAFMLHSQFDVEGITKATEQWRKGALQDADVSAASIDQSMAAEQPMTMAMRELRPMRAGGEWMEIFIPQHEQLVRTVLAYSQAFDPDYKKQFGSTEPSATAKVDLDLVSISISRGTKSIPIDKLLKRQADREDVKESLMPAEQYIAEHVMPGADTDAIQKQAQEYEAARDAEQNRLTDLFPPARPGTAASVPDGATNNGEQGGPRKKTPAERALDRVKPQQG